MAFDPNNYLDLWNILVYEVIGGVPLALMVGLILISYFSIRYAIPFQVSLIMLLSFISVVVAATGDLGLWTVVVSIVGIITYGLLSRVLRRG